MGHGESKRNQRWNRRRCCYSVPFNVPPEAALLGSGGEPVYEHQVRVVGLTVIGIRHGEFSFLIARSFGLAWRMIGVKIRDIWSVHGNARGSQRRGRMSRGLLFGRSLVESETPLNGWVEVCRETP